MDLNTIILAVAAFLFVIALIALTAWAFKALVLGGSNSGPSFLRGRERRLGLVESSAIDAKHRLLLIKRDDVEHLIMTGGPVDIVVETGIKPQAPKETPVDDVIIARDEVRPVPDYGKS
jgi:flagellar protein FliO/FliZ